MGWRPNTLLFVFLILGSGTLLSAAPIPQAATAEPPAKSSAAEMDVQKNLASYDKVWQTIKKSHWDPELVGESWDAAKPKYRSRVEQAKDMAEVRQAMEDLIGELGQSHFGIIPSDSYEDVGDEPKGEGTLGITIRLLEKGVPVVTKVAPGSSAEEAGVKPGWRLLKIGNKEMAKVLDKLNKLESEVMRKDTMAGMSLTNGCQGEVGKKKKLVFQDHEGQQRELELELKSPPGKLTKFGNLPDMRIEVESRTLSEGVGYFRFNMFFDPARVMSSYFKSVNDPAHQKGFVIDLRGNVGGMGGMTMGMARPFAKEATKLGTMVTRQGKLRFAVAPAADTYPGKVAILIDSCSISSSEILSGGLQDLGAAKVFGSRTAGLALPSQITRLPNGDGFQYAFADYVSEKGKKLEKLGVTPDFPIELTVEALKTDPDPVLTAALEWINSQN